jgi:hypothetical protein
MDAKAGQIKHVTPTQTGASTFWHQLSPHFWDGEPETHEQIRNGIIKGKNEEAGVREGKV